MENASLLRNTYLTLKTKPVVKFKNIKGTSFNKFFLGTLNSLFDELFLIQWSYVLAKQKKDNTNIEYLVNLEVMTIKQA